MFVASIRLWIPLLAFMLPSLAVCGSRAIEAATGQPGRDFRRVHLATVIAPRAVFRAPPSADIAQPSAAIAQPSGNVLVAGPKLTFAAINSQKLKWNLPGETQADIYRDYDKIVTRYVFQSPYAANFTWRWQVSTKPFAAQASVSAPGIVGQGLVSGTAFAIDLTGFPPLGESKVKGLKSTSSIGAQTRRGETFSNASRPASGLYYVPLKVDAPVDLFVRIIAIKDNKPVGPPSNTVVAHFKLGLSPTMRAMQKSFEWAARVKELQAKAKMFQIALTSFTPAAFPTQIGCVVIVDNPHYGKPLDVFANHKKDETYCPPDDPKYQEKSDWDWFVEALKGYAFAWDKLVELYDEAKSWVVDQVVSIVPCEALGEDAGAVCEKALEKLGNAALTVALAAAGVPPTLPDIATLTELGKGKVVEVAVDFTCNRLADSGAPCDAFMRQKLTQLYKSGVNEIQSGISVEQATEPECGQSQFLTDAGKRPLPCFGKQGIKVKAAPGAFYRPPLVTLKVTRIKPPMGVPTDCMITTALALENHFKGGSVGGVMTGAKDIQGEPFYPVSSPVPTLKMGESKALTLAMTTPQGFSISANSWSKTGVYTEWLALYQLGKGQLTTESATTSLKLDETPIKTQCSETVHSPVTIP